MPSKQDYVMCVTCTHTTNMHDEFGICHAIYCECKELKLKKGQVIPDDAPVYNSNPKNRSRRVRMER